MSKVPRKYRGLAWEVSSGWNGFKDLGIALGESLSEFSSDNGKGEQLIDLGEMKSPVPAGHLFASLSYQFGRLGPWTQPTYATYGGDIGSVLQAMYISGWDPNVIGNVDDLDNVISQKFGNDQKDADIAAHVIAKIVQEDNVALSKAIETFKNMTQKQKYEKFIQIEFGDLAQAKYKIADSVFSYFNDRDITMSDVYMNFNKFVPFTMEAFREAVNKTLNDVIDRFIEYIR